MFKVTIEDNYGQVTVQSKDEDVAVVEAVDLLYRAMLASGYAPQNVAEAFAERGSDELAVLND